MKTFQEWLKEADQDIYSEIDWKKTGRNLALGGALLGSGLGLGKWMGGSDIPSQKVTYPAAQRFIEPEEEARPVAKPSTEIEPHRDYIKRTKGMHGAERVGEWKKRAAKRQVKREIEKYGAPKVGAKRSTAPDVADYL